MKKLFLLLSILSVFVFACNKEDEPEPGPPQASKVFYISNEGAYGYGNASVTLFYPEENSVQNDAFMKANNRHPGDVLQSVYQANNKMYLLVNASNKIEIAAPKTLKELGVITNIKMPRYMVSRDDKTAYVSSWGGGSKGQIQLIDIVNDKVISTINVGNGPEKMLINSRADDRLIVCNSGGFSNDSTLSIIDTRTKQLIATTKVADNPIDLVLETNGFWVLCKGKVIYDANFNITGHTPSYLLHLNDNGQIVNNSAKLFEEQHPGHMAIDPGRKYIYVGGGFGFKGIYRFDITTNTLDTIPLIDKEFYGFNVDMETGDLYCFEAPSFTASGKMHLYNKEGKLLKSFTVGIGPNGIFME